MYFSLTPPTSCNKSNVPCHTVSVILIPDSDVCDSNYLIISPVSSSLDNLKITTPIVGRQRRFSLIFFPISTNFFMLRVICSRRYIETNEYKVINVLYKRETNIKRFLEPD